MAKYIMTRNEAQRFLRQQANLLYKNEISMEEYKSIDIEYIPLDLSMYPEIKEDTKKWINILFTEEDTDRSGKYLLRGFTNNPFIEMEKLNLHYGDYSRDLSFWGYNDEEMMLYTYCEGDTTLQMYTEKEYYKTAKQKMLYWYRDEF